VRRVEVPGNVEGHFFLHSMPGRYEPIEEFLTDIILKNITCVVGFASPDEIRQKSPAYAAVLDGTAPWEHIAFPISNLLTPHDLSPEPVSREIVRRLRQGKNVAKIRKTPLERDAIMTR
jgi:hypothetical protein